jgi:hypothetical protein
VDGGVIRGSSGRAHCEAAGGKGDDMTGRNLGGGLRKKTGRTKETWFLSEVQHNLDILLFKHMDVHDPFRSKSSEIQLKKSNWIWIIPNLMPGLQGRSKLTSDLYRFLVFVHKLEACAHHEIKPLILLN